MMIQTLVWHSKILEEQDFKVQAYDIPQVALDNFRTGAYDLIVLDIKMPKIDGIKLYQEIRKVDRNVRVFRNCIRGVLYWTLSRTK